MREEYKQAADVIRKLQEEIAEDKRRGIQRPKPVITHGDRKHAADIIAELQREIAQGKSVSHPKASRGAEPVVLPVVTNKSMWTAGKGLPPGTRGKFDSVKWRANRASGEGAQTADGIPAEVTPQDTPKLWTREEVREEFMRGQEAVASLNATTTPLPLPIGAALEAMLEQNRQVHEQAEAAKREENATIKKHAADLRRYLEEIGVRKEKLRQKVEKRVTKAEAVQVLQQIQNEHDLISEAEPSMALRRGLNRLGGYISDKLLGAKESVSSSGRVAQSGEKIQSRWRKLWKIWRESGPHNYVANLEKKRDDLQPAQSFVRGKMPPYLTGKHTTYKPEEHSKADEHDKRKGSPKLTSYEAALKGDYAALVQWAGPKDLLRGRAAGETVDEFWKEYDWRSRRMAREEPQRFIDRAEELLQQKREEWEDDIRWNKRGYFSKLGEALKYLE